MHRQMLLFIHERKKNMSQQKHYKQKDKACSFS